LATACLSPAPAVAVEVEARVVEIIDGYRDLNKNGKIDPYENWSLTVEERVNDLLPRMNLTEKINQMAYPSVGVKAGDDPTFIVSDGGYEVTAESEAKIGVGFMMPPFFGDTRKCVDGVNKIQAWAEATRLGIPIVFGIDPHTRVYGGTKISGGDRTMALSATQDLDLVQRVYEVWSEEMRASGIHLILGPHTDLSTDPRGIRNLDHPGEDADWAYEMNRAIIKGLQGDELGTHSVLAVPKHFPGIGSSGGGHDGHQGFLGKPKPPEGLNMGTPLKSNENTIKWHWKPFEGAIAAGTWAVMSPYYVFSEFMKDEPNKVEIILQDWLRGELGFEGVILTDWGAMTPFADIQGGCSSPKVTKRFNEWLDNNETNEDRIDDSIRKILTAKFQLGLFDNPYVDADRADAITDSEEHRAIAKEAAHKGQVVLKNEGNLIPLPEGKTVLWADDHAPDEVGELAKNFDIAVVHVTGYNGIDHRRYIGHDLEMFVEDESVQRLRAIHETGTPIVAIYHVRGNPFPIPWVAENAAAILFAPGGHWHDGGKNRKTAGGWRGILSGEYEPRGTLPIQIPRSMEQVKAQREDLPFDLGCTEAEMDLIDEMIGRGERPPTNLGDPLFHYGITGWGKTINDQPARFNDTTAAITEKTPSVPQYFSWINNTNEGSTEEQTLTNLEFFKWLHDEYGMYLEVYAWDAGNIDGIDGPRSYGSTDTEKFRKQFPNGWNPIVEKAASMGTRLGIWLGPDGFGDTPEEEAKRTDMLVRFTRDYNLQLFKMDVVTQLREEKQDAFANAMIAAREYAPDLIVLNHRVELGTAAPHATTTLLGGRETYIDIHMTNGTTGTHNRVAAITRRTTPGLTRLTEDHGVCLSSSLDYWEDDLILQAFNRSLILAPEIYGNPWLLSDDEFPKLARIYNLHGRNGDILVNGMELPESYGPSPVARGDDATRFLTLRNLTWSPVTYTVRLDEEIGLTKSGTVHLRRYHPAERIIGDFDYGQTVDIVVPPFRSYLLMATVEPCPELGVWGSDYEVVRDTEGKPAIIKLLGMPGDKVSVKLDRGATAYTTATLDGKRNNKIFEKGAKIQFAGTPISKPFHRKLADLNAVPVPTDAEQLYESTTFAASNNALEIQSLKRSGPTQIPQVAASRDAFFNQDLFWQRGIWDKYLFDGNLDTFFGVYHWQFGDQRVDGGTLRLDLGEETALGSLTMQTLRRLDRNEPAPESLVAEISSDLTNWRTIRFGRSPKQVDTRVKVVKIDGNGGSHRFFDTSVYSLVANLNDSGSFRYLRMADAPDRIAEIVAHKDEQVVTGADWHATHLFAPYKKPAAAWEAANVHIDADTPKGSYLCVAIEGNHGIQGAFAALRMNGEYIGATQRAMSMPSAVWEMIPAKHGSNYTYYFPVTEEMLGQDVDVTTLAFDGEKTDLKPHVWITAYPVPYETIELRLETKG
jgi:beta-glucosidase-like glycosyl hydrolase